MTPPDYVQAAVGLRRSHPVPAHDILDLVMRGRGASANESEAAWLQPGFAFGALLAAAFDVVMTPAEWVVMSGEAVDVRVAEVLRGLWRGIVIDGFLRWYPPQG